jgi:hypothetical protein
MSRSITKFISNDNLWREINARVNNGKTVKAAVAYLGQKGSELLPLKNGDHLVIDMSLGTVRAGVTDPREVRKLMNKGVKVFSRGSLHAKFIIIDKTLIASSANISNNSNNKLDEVGIVTTDSTAIRRALEFFEKLCTEPVREQYLKACIKAYKPQPFDRGKQSQKSGRIRQAKLWFISGIKDINPSEKEKKSIETVEKKAEKKLKNPDKTSVAWIQYARRPKYLNDIQPGDWVVKCTSDGSSQYVSAPEQALSEDIRIASSGNKYYMFMTESPDAGETLSLSVFRRRIRSLMPALDRDKPRTQPIENNDHADAILGIWTPAGRLSRA